MFLPAIFISVIIFGLAVWAFAVRQIFSSSKFRRKWLWFVLSLGVVIVATWDVTPNFSVAVGLPVGAMIVLWHWRYGRAP
ncbi:hypothetical protein D1227_03940 [Henriciella mobilis]|nr:hypothetical protein D1231_04610 [Henriciella mobilis]RIJ25487.1 hypothetical protein D1227_03940 [Henriciella mobilis]